VSRYLAATSKDVGELVRGFRKQRGWTQAQLAERAGLLPKTVSAIEAGSGQVLLANVMRCLSALNVGLSLDSRSGTQTMREPMPTIGRPPQAVLVAPQPKAAKPRRLPDDDAVASPPVAKPTRKSLQSSSASRAKAAAKALTEKW
jgi:HTH-type transcriptional regulator/antitoxin HipB